MSDYIIGKQYFYLDPLQGAAFWSFITGNGYDPADFGLIIISGGQYEGYYFDPDAIDEDEYDIIERYSDLAAGVVSRAIWDSVQPGYIQVP